MGLVCNSRRANAYKGDDAIGWLIGAMELTLKAYRNVQTYFQNGRSEEGESVSHVPGV